MKMRRKIKHVLSKLGTKSSTVISSEKLQLDSVTDLQKATSGQQTTSNLSTSNDSLNSNIHAQECKVPLKKRKSRQPKLPQDLPQDSISEEVVTNSENSIIKDKLLTQPPDNANESEQHNNRVNSNQTIRIDVDSTTRDIIPGVKLVKQGKNIDQNLYKLANCNPSYKLSWDNYKVGQYTLKAEKRKLQRQFTCPVCDRSFGYKHVLQKHTRIHRGEKPFHCSQCNKGFTQEHHMVTHMRVHTGERPYRCSACPRTFAQVANLRRHLRIHSGERPYACSVCQKTFPSSGHVKKHLRIHTGERPHVCMLCQQAFRLQHHLTDHMKTHRDVGNSHSTPPLNGIRKRNNNKTLTNARKKSTDLSVTVKAQPQTSSNNTPTTCQNTSKLKTSEQSVSTNANNHADTPLNNCVGGKLDCVIQKLTGKIDKHKNNLTKCDSIIQALKSNQQVEPLDYSTKRVSK